MRIYLIRHGRQCSKACNVDVSLDEAGRKQAALAGDRLKNYGIELLYSSHLKRAVETADIINDYINVEHVILPQLRESDFGILTGMMDEEIKQQFPELSRQRILMEEDIPYLGGENGQMVYDRAFPVIEKIAHSGVGAVAIVTHGGVIRSLIAGICGTSQAHRLSFAKDLENCSITELMYKPENGRFYIERINDYAHLEADETLLRNHFKKGF
ncbi:MAG: histidine phosphatase family protein [Eubacterium sp.]